MAEIVPVFRVLAKREETVEEEKKTYTLAFYDQSQKKFNGSPVIHVYTDDYGN